VSAGKHCDQRPRARFRLVAERILEMKAGERRNAVLGARLARHRFADFRAVRAVCRARLAKAAERSRRTDITYVLDFPPNPLRRYADN
jgi:hypothetical protein